MKVSELIERLREFYDEGHADDEVRLICASDNPLNCESRAIKGAFLIYNHSESEVNGVYIDGTN